MPFSPAARALTFAVARSVSYWWTEMWSATQISPRSRIAATSSKNGMYSFTGTAQKSW